MLEGVKITEDAAAEVPVVEGPAVAASPPADAGTPEAADGTVADGGGTAGASPIIIPEAKPEGFRTNAAAALDVLGTEAAELANAGDAAASPASPSPNELDAGNC